MKSKQTFPRFALPITWDFGEANPLSEADRYLRGSLEWVRVASNTAFSRSLAMPVPDSR